MESYSILLVDDHKLFREGLKLLLENLDIVHEVKEAGNGREFLEILADYTPDLVFLDIEMPEIDGIRAARQALNTFPGLKIIALSMYGDEEYYTQMISAGAKGFVLKNSDMQEIEAAIRNVLAGDNYFSKEILNRIFSGIGKKSRTVRQTDLSEREQEVLFYICKGLSNQEIADKLYLSKRTVDKHRENLLAKTNARNTAGLVMYAVKNGVVEV